MNVSNSFFNKKITYYRPKGSIIINLSGIVISFSIQRRASQRHMLLKDIERKKRVEKGMMRCKTMRN